MTGNSSDPELKIETDRDLKRDPRSIHSSQSLKLFSSVASRGQLAAATHRSYTHWFQEISTALLEEKFSIPFISLWSWTDGDEPALIRSTFHQGTFTHDERIPMSDCLVTKLCREGRNLLYPTLPQELKSQSKVIPPDSESVLVVPVIKQGHLTGAWCLASPYQAQWNEEEISFFEALASQIQVIEALWKKKSANPPTHFESAAGFPQTASLPGVTENQPSVKTSSQKTYDVIGSSKPIADILSMIDRIAPTTASILILGESGTGKEMLARRLHTKSQRAQGAYVTVNCAALMESLLESELFGHEKGSFTGAVSQKIGLCEVADQGTLFLDEIGEMSPGIQTKMLRFLQEGEFYRIGGKKPIHVSVRIVAATNRDLAKEVADGRFREDLYYRLNTISLKIPPLRDRKSDIPELARYFLSNSKYSDPKTAKSFHEDVLTKLTQYAWPGNIRELQNTVERMRILSEGTIIQTHDIPEFVTPPKMGTATQFLTQQPELPWKEECLENIEKNHILKTFEHYQGNKTKTAHSLGITIKTLYNKLNRYGLHQITGAPPLSIPGGEELENN